MVMRKINKLNRIWIVIIALCLTFIAPPMQGQSSDPPTRGNQVKQKTECDEIAVNNYPLWNLVDTVINECRSKPLYLEDLPLDRVNVDSYNGDVLGHLAGKFLFVIQPLAFGPGTFRKQSGYEGGEAEKTKAVVVGLTQDLVNDGKPRPIAKGNIRLYKDKNGDYQIHSNAALAKTILDMIYRIFGGDPATNAKTFVKGTAEKLFDLGVNLEEGDVKVSLGETAKHLDEKLKLSLVKKIYAAHLAASANESEVSTELWPLTFVHSRIAKEEPSNSNSGDSIDKMVAALNARFEAGSVIRSRQMLLITGTAKKRIAIKRLLTEYDLPWPQVQMNLWIAQVSGKPDQIIPKLLAIKSYISLTQAAMAEVLVELNDLINEKKKDCVLRERLRRLEKIGFNRKAEDVLALNEALIILALLDDPADIVEKLDKKVECVLKDLEKDVNNKYKGIKDLLKPTPALNDKELQCRVTSVCGPKLKHTAKIYDSYKIHRARDAIEDFVEILIEYRDNPNDAEAPAKLRRESAAVDRLLQGAVEAYAADMQQLFLDPLLLRIQLLNGAKPRRRSWGSEGVTLTGQSRLVVTSTMTTSLDTEMASYANVTRPKPFDVSTLLNTALPRQEQFSVLDSTPKPMPKPSPSDAPTPTPATAPAPQVMAGAQRIFGTLGPGEAFLLAAALANEVEPNFHQVTPGVSIKIQPTVLPDGGAARLAMECEFKVDSQEFGNSGNDIRKQPFADSVKKHKVTTDAAVKGFDLFDISSFSMESSYPQAPFSLPVLGRLPIIGQVFQYPRDKKRVHHESIILVNTIILPRAMDLARFYGAN